MTKSFFSLLIIGLTLITPSCKKQTAEQPLNIEKQLLGKWKFERTRLSNGVVYVAVPTEVDIIEFKPNRIYQRSTNGVEGAKGTYELTQPINIFTNKKDYAITLLPQQNIPNIISITADSLYMMQNISESISSVFSRVK